jgi:hypothetical protein
MHAMIGPDRNPPAFNGAAWVSQDGRYWWNGAAWQPIKRRGFRPPLAVTVIVLVVLGGARFVLKSIHPLAPPALGVAKASIVSSTEFTFDYRRSTTCNDLTFSYLFFDKGGTQVDKFADEKHNLVLGDKTYHFHIYAYGLTIDSHATRFDAIPSCNA